MCARDLLAALTGAGLTITADGDRLVLRPASMLTQEMRDTLRLAKAELLALLRESRRDPSATDQHRGDWTAVDVARFSDHCSRFVNWGWSKTEAERWAARLVRRDIEADPRFSCAECHGYRPGRCNRYGRAGLKAAQVGSDLVMRLQRCPAFEPCRPSGP
jgi:hypothetical protein